MNHYKISYTLNAVNERVYPSQMKGVVFTLTQDHPVDPVMIAATPSQLVEEDSAIVALSTEAAEALIAQFKDGFPKPPMSAGMMPLPPGPAS